MLSITYEINEIAHNVSTYSHRFITKHPCVRSQSQYYVRKSLDLLQWIDKNRVRFWVHKSRAFSQKLIFPSCHFSYDTKPAQLCTVAWICSPVRRSDRWFVGSLVSSLFSVILIISAVITNCPPRCSVAFQEISLCMDYGDRVGAILC